MPKQLLLMRHAKSAWDNHGQSDHDRPLNERGLRDAPRMAHYLNEQNLVPDLVISSSAKRALGTARLLIENFNRQSVELEVVNDLYHAPPDVYAEYCQRLADQYQRPMFIGHNPGMEELVNEFSASWQSMPTAAVAILRLQINKWSEFNLANSSGELQDVFRPKEVF